MIAPRPTFLAASCFFTLAACAPTPSSAPPPAAPIASEAAPPPAPHPLARTEDPMITEWHDGPKIPAPSDVENAPADAARMPSGLVTKVLRYGTGTEHPQSGARVVVRYSGWTIDGAMFDSSVTRGTPAKLPVDGVIEGFSEGLKLMVVGEQRRLWIPSILAYGAKPGRPHGTLVFDVELVAIEQP